MKRTLGLLGILLLAAATLPAMAQATSEARGEIVDQNGDPVQGVTVTFSPESNPALTYQGTTSKKGKYFVPGMFTGKEQDMWKITLEVEGLVPYEMRLESRTANRTLVGDIRTVKIKPGQELPSVPIRPLGSATIDFKLAPPDQVAELLGIAPTPQAGGEGAPAPAQPQMDAWSTALTYAQDGNLEGSTEFFDKAIEDEPDSAERRRAYAQVLYQLERFDEASTQAAKAAELAPGDVGALRLLGTIQIRDGELEQAKATLDQALALDPTNVEVLRQLAFVAEKSGSPAAQMQAYEALVAVEPEDADAWLALGYLYAESGATDKSEQAYERVSELDPKNAHQVFFNRGALLINADDRTDEDTRKAIGMFRRAIEINPKYAPAYRELGFALLNVGDRAGARRALEGYLQVAPEAPDAARIRPLIKALPEA